MTEMKILIVLQDEFALRSHTYAQQATDNGYLTDILPYKVPSKSQPFFNYFCP